MLSLWASGFCARLATVCFMEKRYGAAWFNVSLAILDAFLAYYFITK